MVSAAGINPLRTQTGLAGYVAADGTATHAVPARLAHGMGSPRDVADAVHQLCTLHGRQPGAIDHARSATADSRAADWLQSASAAFAGERAYLVRLAAAAGPLPSTPGQAATESAMLAQRHAIDMLAQSVRPGCALGAAVALVLDWPAIRVPLDAAAIRLGLEVPTLDLPPAAATGRLIATLCADPAIDRAMRFGAQQLLAQHRGLWDLIEARAVARG